MVIVNCLFVSKSGHFNNTEVIFWQLLDNKQNQTKRNLLIILPNYGDNGQEKQGHFLNPCRYPCLERVLNHYLQRFFSASKPCALQKIDTNFKHTVVFIAINLK